VLVSEYKKFGIPASIWFAHILTSKREEMTSILKNHGISVGIHHYRNDMYTIFGGIRQNLPKMNQLENQYLILPLHHGVSVRDVRNICQLLISQGYQKKI
jgi:dTDP-4-amino-4,6-dideoxygalactose transaminase